MKLTGILWLVVIVTVVLLENERALAAPNPHQENMWKTLMELDRMYSAVARPSVRSGPVIRSDMTPKVQRAINVLKLHHLERLYADRARPRFGKRTGSSSNKELNDYENQVSGGENGDYYPFRR